MRYLCVCAALLGSCTSIPIDVEPIEEEQQAASTARIRVNLLLERPLTPAMRAELVASGDRAIVHEFRRIHAVTLMARPSELESIRNLPFVIGANPDARREVHGLPVEDFAHGTSAWFLDAINITDALRDVISLPDPFTGVLVEGIGTGREVPYDGTGVYVGVLDSGLGHRWREYFPEQRIASGLARSFTGGGESTQDHFADQPHHWERDTIGHGTAVAATILGYSVLGIPVNGAAPRATVIPVRVCGGAPPCSAFSSVVTHGLEYLTELKVSGALGDAPLVVNMSLGGGDDFVERAAIDDAIANGVIVVASAGNSGPSGMLYPGGYPPVIAPGAVGSVLQFTPADPYWFLHEIPEHDASAFFVTDFSAREFPGQDLDILAPGVAVFLPAAGTPGRPAYGFWYGTSFSGPLVAGVAALLLEKNPTLRQEDVDALLTATALPIAPGCRDGVVDFFTGIPSRVCWEANAVGAGLVQADAALAATPLP